MPEMGEGVIEGTIGRWLVKEGDRVEEYDPILEIETDKVTTEAVAETSGVLLKINVGAGETVEVGAILGVIGEEGEQPASAPVQQAAVRERTVGSEQRTAVHGVAVAEHRKRVNGAKDAEVRRELGRISPVVSRMASEHDLDLYQIEGTGRGGRITKRDVQAYLDGQEADSSQQSAVSNQPAVARQTQTSAPAPVAQAAPVMVSGGDTDVPHTAMRRSIAKHMVESKRTSPHVTTVFEVDFSAVVAHRNANKADFASKGVKLTFTPYIMLAAAAALRDNPHANSSWSDDGVVLRGALNLGMATAIESGLIVPVIKGADELNLLGMARRVNDLAERARNNQLKPDEVTGGTFTITNHGVSGSLFATPIINQPQVGILGVGKIQKRVVVIEGEFGDTMAIRPMSYLSFTFDHRVLDGASADAFVASVVENLEGFG